MIQPSTLLRAAAAGAIAWTVMIGGFLTWNWSVERRHADDLARKEARIHFNKDLAFRRWATRHGGVYVPVDARTPANPGLAHVAERDIRTPSGRALTLMNPAYIMRQAMGDYAELFGVRGKLTSLKLINPDNAADAWETAALKEFERGATEVSAFTEIAGEPYLRLMGVLKVEAGCLKCHAYQGYQLADVRGGVGVTVPMQPYHDAARANFQALLPPFVLVWLLGLAAIAAFYAQIRQRLAEQAQAEASLARNNVTITRANADLTRFAEISAHHLMEPTRRLASYAQRLRPRLAALPELRADAEVNTALDTLERDAGHLRGLVRDIQLYLAAAQPRAELCREDAEAALAAVRQRLAARLTAQQTQLSSGALPPAWIDKPRLMDLFALLLDNALVHGRPDAAGVAAQISVSGERDGRLSRYRVVDNGPGVPAEYRLRVFEIFERLKPAGESSGTGIGLSIARRIVESRHGRIWIDGAPQGGASVVFELPDGEPT